MNKTSKVGEGGERGVRERGGEGREGEGGEREGGERVRRRGERDDRAKPGSLLVQDKSVNSTDLHHLQVGRLANFVKAYPFSCFTHLNYQLYTFLSICLKLVFPLVVLYASVSV